jgi:hypothetical protein
VSLSCPHERQCTRERRRPPKSLCTHVVSAIFGSSFLGPAGQHGRDGVRGQEARAYGGCPARHDFCRPSMR